MQAKLWWFKRLWKVEKSNYSVARVNFSIWIRVKTCFSFTFFLKNVFWTYVILEKCFKVWRLKISSIRKNVVLNKYSYIIFMFKKIQNQMTVGNLWTPRLCWITFDNPWQLWKDYSETELASRSLVYYRYTH